MTAARRPDGGYGRAGVASWILYDWGYGAFTTIVSTFVIPAYFTQAVAANPAEGSSLWAAGQSVAGLLIALVAVPLGAVADRGGRGRVMLGMSSLLMVAATAGLWWVRPRHDDVALALILVGAATVAFEVALIFYNAMLPLLCAATPERLGRLSMLAWGAGYAGGLAALGLCLLVLVLPATPPFGLDRESAEPVRACALVAAGWMLLFGWPVVARGPHQPARGFWRDAVREGLAELRPLVASAWGERTVRRFLLARLFYMDGLVTLFAFGGIYAAGQFGLDTKGVLLFGIGLTVTAGVGVLVGALVEDRIGSRVTILASVVVLGLLGTALLLVHDRATFWVLGLSLGLFVGPAQAASRSFMARLAPPGGAAAYFGLLALSGRVTAFLGPAALSLVTGVTGSQRAGMGVIVVFLLTGAALLATIGRAPPAGRGVPRSPASPVAPPARRAGSAA